MSKGTRYELLVYVRPVKGNEDYRIESSKPFPAFIIGQVFKSYALEKHFPLDEGREFRIRDVEITHCSRSEEPHIWQTKLRLAEVDRLRSLPIPLGDKIPSGLIEKIEQDAELEAKAIAANNAAWNSRLLIQGE